MDSKTEVTKPVPSSKPTNVLAGPPNHMYHFVILREGGGAIGTNVMDWTASGAWATLWRDLGKGDHGPTHNVIQLSLTSVKPVTTKAVA